MATDVDAVLVRIIATQKEYEKQMSAVARAAERAAAASERSFTDAGRRMARNNADAMKQMEQNAKNLSFQMGDVFQGLLGGQSPWQVALQQTEQIAHSLTGAGSVKEGLKTVASAFTGLINPASIGIGAVILGLGALQSYLSDTEEEVEDLDKVLKKHGDFIAGLKDKYGIAAQGVDQYGKEVSEVLKVGAASRAVEELATLRAETRKLFEAGQLLESSTGRAPSEFGRQLGEASKTASPQVEKLKELILELRKEAATGEPDVKKFREEVAKVAASNPANEALQAIAASLLSVSENAFKAQTNLSETRDVLGQIEQIAARLQQTTLDPLGVFGDPKRPPTDLDDWEEWGKKAGGAFDKGLSDYLTSDKPLSHADLESSFGEKLLAMLQTAPDQGIKIFSGRRTLERQKELYDEAIRKYGRADLPGHQVAFPTPMAPHVSGRAADLRFDNENVKRWAQENAKQFGLEFKVEGEYWHISEIETQKAAKAKKTAYDDWLTQSQKAIEAQQRENEIRGNAALSVNEQTAAVEAYRIAQEGLDAARAQGLTITPALTAQIEAQAVAMAKLGLQASNAKDAQEKFTEQQRKQTEAAAALNRQVAGIAQTALSGFINDLRNGVDAADAFTNALDRIVDGLIQMAIQALFSQQIMGGLSTLLGGLGGFPAAPAGGGGLAGGGLFRAGGMVGTTHHSDGRRFAAALWANAPRFATGGMVGLRPGEVPIIAHQGEYVVPRNMVGKMGGGEVNTSIHNDMKIAIDMKSGDVVANTEQARNLGLQIERSVQQVLIRESRPGGLLRQGPARG